MPNNSEKYSETGNDKVPNKRRKQFLAGVAFFSAGVLRGVASAGIDVGLEARAEQKAIEQLDAAATSLDVDELYSDIAIVDAGVYEGLHSDTSDGKYIYVDVKRTPTETFQKALDGDFENIPENFKHYPSQNTELTPEQAEELRDERVREVFWDSQLFIDGESNRPIAEYLVAAPSDDTERFVIPAHVAEGYAGGRFQLSYGLDVLNSDEPLTVTETDDPIKGVLSVDMKDGHATKVNITQK